MVKITVIGSCACRDLFESDSENFSFYSDFRFMSPISITSKPVNGFRLDFCHFPKRVKFINGNWYKKNLINDFNKTAFSALDEKHGDFLVLDFAESRIGLAEIFWDGIDDSLLLTNSVSFKSQYRANLKNNILKNATIKTINPLEISDDLWRDSIRTFSEKIKKVFNEENIILIKNMPAKYYVDFSGVLRPYFTADHFNNICLCDILLEKINNMFIEYCPKCNVIEIPDFALGYQLHKWGNHPFHFTKLYYEYLLECVKAITIQNNAKLLEQLFNIYSEKFLLEFKKAQLLSAKNSDYRSIPATYLENFEDYNLLGRKQKALVAFALDKGNFFKDLRRILKK